MTIHIPAPHERGRLWTGRSLRWIAGGLSFALAVTLTEGVAAADPPEAPAKPRETAVTQAADIASARVAARLSGKRVEASRSARRRRRRG